MGFELRLSQSGQKDLIDLPPDARRRIVKKMMWFCAQNDPLVFSSALKHPSIGERRYRIGDYRVIVCVDQKKKHLVIVAVGHRSTIYQF